MQDADLDRVLRPGLSAGDKYAHAANSAAAAVRRIVRVMVKHTSVRVPEGVNRSPRNG